MWTCPRPRPSPWRARNSGWWSRINAKREVFLNQEKVDPPLLRRHLERSTAARLNREVFLRADRSVPYGFVVRIMAEIKNAGIEKLGMVTEPFETRK